MSKRYKLEKVEFPIKLTVQICGHDYTKTLKKGDTVRCLRCGQPIYVNSKSVFKVDDLPYITCQNVLYKDFYGVKHRCGYKAFALYYIEQKERDSWKHGKVVQHGLL